MGVPWKLPPPEGSAPCLTSTPLYQSQPRSDRPDRPHPTPAQLRELGSEPVIRGPALNRWNFCSQASSRSWANTIACPESASSSCILPFIFRSCSSSAKRRISWSEKLLFSTSIWKEHHRELSSIRSPTMGHSY